MRKRKIKIKFVDGPIVNHDQIREIENKTDSQDGEEADYKKNIIYQWLLDRYDVEYSEQPEYIFYSVYSDNYLKYDCIRIFYTGEAQTPDFNLCDYAIGFDNLSFGDRYFRYPLVNNYYPGDSVVKLQKSRKFTKADLNRKKRFCDFIFSNQKGDDYRRVIFNELSKYREVTAAGSYLNNIGYRISDKIKFQSESKFSIAFENTLFDGYTTEKLGDPFFANSLPIYWGNPTVAEQFNNKAFVNCHEFDNIDDIINRVIEIDNNDDLYIQMMNEPIYSSQYNWIEHVQNYKQFLYNIIDQPYQDAFRRNRGCRGAIYESSIKNNRIKFRMYYNLLIKWIYVYRDVKKIEDYFSINNISKVAIYGMGELGRILFDELCLSDKVKIELLIDQKKGSAFGKVKVLSIYDDISQELINKGIELIIVTPIFSYNEIEKELIKKTNIKTVSLEEIIHKLL